MNLYEKLNRLDDSLVESKRVVKKKKLTESYSNEMTEFMNWIQDYKNGALWDDFTAEFEAEQDPDISVVLTWLENFDEDAYYDYVAADTYDDDIDEMLTESDNSDSFLKKIREATKSYAKITASDYGVRLVSLEDDLASYIIRDKFNKYVEDCLNNKALDSISLI